MKADPPSRILINMTYSEISRLKYLRKILLINFNRSRDPKTRIHLEEQIREMESWIREKEIQIQAIFDIHRGQLNPTWEQQQENIIKNSGWRDQSELSG